MRSLKAVLGLAVMAFVLAGCGGSGTNPSSSGAAASTSAPSSGAGSSTGSGSTQGSGSGTGSGSGSGTGTGTSTPTVGSATLHWQAPSTNTNGTALTDLAGYHIYYGTNTGSLSTLVVVSNPATVTYVINNLNAGTWYFAVAAYTTAGLESARSNVGSKTIT